MAIYSNQECPVTKIKIDLTKNEYKNTIVKSAFAKCQNPNTKQEDTTQGQMLTIPQMRNLQKNRNIAKKQYKNHIQVIRSYLTATKSDAINNTINGIYRNVSKQKRTLEIKLSEHRKHTQRGEKIKSGVGKHAWTKHHKIEWYEEKIIRASSVVALAPLENGQRSLPAETS